MRQLNYAKVIGCLMYAMNVHDQLYQMLLEGIVDTQAIQVKTTSMLSIEYLSI